MEVFTLEEWEENFDDLLERVENGEHIGIVREDGTAAVMMPADDELLRIYTDNNNEAQQFICGNVAYWLKPSAYNGVNRVQFSAFLFAPLAIW